MQAILTEDIIVRLVINGGTEIGGLPPGVGLERLRFDGQQVVDLAEMTAIWVRPLGSTAFELHAVEVPGAFVVAMTYAARETLVLDPVNGIRLKTTAELDDEDRAAQLAAIKATLRTRLKNQVGAIEDQQMNTLAFVCALIVYSRTQNAALGQFFDDIIPVIKDIFPLARVEQILKDAGVELKAAMQAYYDALDQIGGD